MRVLFDQGTPAPLRAALTGHVVETAYECGWSTLKNGELLLLRRSPVLKSSSRPTQLRYQQNLTARRFAIVVLSTTSWPRIRAANDVVSRAVDSAVEQRYLEVMIP